MLLMKSKSKIIILLLIIMMIIQINPLIIANTQDVKNQYTIKYTEITSTLTDIKIKTVNNYSIITTNFTNAELHEYGKPILPYISKTIFLPLNSEIESIKFYYLYHKTAKHNNELKLSLNPIPKTINYNISNYLTNLESFENKTFFKKDGIFPKNSFDYTIGCGLHNGSRVLIVQINLYPIRYIYTDNIIEFGDCYKLNISYSTSEIKPKSSNQYDMVIISPLKFIPSLQPLVWHKNSHGVKTIVKSVESIYRESRLGKFDGMGKDDAEKIKYFIKYAIEEWNISYVLLVGGHKQQKQNWYVPVRYSNLHDRSFWNDSYVTDLYFADIYRYNQSSQQIEFDDWDSNKNGIFAEWTWIFDAERGWWYDLDKKDDLDLYPDVYIGRLSCRDVSEVNIIVNKIIRYEKKTEGKEWFKKILCVGGDTVPYSDGICEGEIETGLAADFLANIGFEANKLWITNGKLTNAKDVRRELNKGTGFIYLSGHGTPIEWCTHPISQGDTWVDVYAFQLDSLMNRNRLPICIVGGCHNNQFDVSLTNMLKGLLTYGISYLLWNEGIDCFGKWTWVKECWSWNLVSLRNGGFIAAIGNTGLGWGVGGESCVEYNEGYLNTQFFKTYAEYYQESGNKLGIIHTENINNYISHFSANDHLLDRKTIEQWALLGDPSLSIGGI